MSTEHVNDADLEYRSTPPGAKHEHTDIDPAIGYKFAVWLLVAMFISAGIVYGTFWFFEGREEVASTAAQQYPLAAGVVRDVPSPRLQPQPFKDVYVLRADEARRLSSYGWVDKQGGVARIPIDRAMEVMLQRGFPVRPEPADALNVVTQDSSSGRTAGPR